MIVTLSNDVLASSCLGCHELSIQLVYILGLALGKTSSPALMHKEAFILDSTHELVCI